MVWNRTVVPPKLDVEWNMNNERWRSSQLYAMHPPRRRTPTFTRSSSPASHARTRTREEEADRSKPEAS
ncbi:hypothetical protein PVAP13_8KG329901 [Panicum virgatum]|uniref:Uncharacterized protein n=1 Tax=Panicum virgatum TaxID=38727 RepID=A0A8T0PIP4_PANVG|nr:hypothetical protein PVAP13_8KG329901 [Panicum virgatum]